MVKKQSTTIQFRTIRRVGEDNASLFLLKIELCGERKLKT